MYYEIYPDVIFLTNLIADYCILIIWIKVGHIRTSHIRLLSGAMAGALWSVIVVCFPELPDVIEILITYFGVGFLMVHIVGINKRLKLRMRELLTFYAINVFAGGAILYLCRSSITTIKIMCGIVIVYQLSVPFTQMMKKNMRKKAVLYKVMLINSDNHILLDALMDTGNFLSDPYNGKPVNVVEKKYISKIADIDFKIDFNIANEANNEFQDFNKSSDSKNDKSDAGKEIKSEEQCVFEKNRIRYIPFKSLGNEHGLMKLITIDCIIIENNGKIRKIEAPEIAIYEGTLSANGEYGAIINPELCMGI